MPQQLELLLCAYNTFTSHCLWFRGESLYAIIIIYKSCTSWVWSALSKARGSNQFRWILITHLLLYFCLKICVDFSHLTRSHTHPPALEWGNLTSSQNTLDHVFVSRFGSRTGGWRTNGRGTPYRGLTLLSTPWELSWWAAPRRPPPCLTRSSRRTSPIFRSTTTTLWPSPRRYPHLTAATAHPWGPWRRSVSPSTTTGRRGCPHPRRPFTPRPASCTTPPRARALFVCTGGQNSCLKPGGSRLERTNHAVQKLTCSLPAWSGGRRWCSGRRMPFNTFKQAAGGSKKQQSARPSDASVSELVSL